MAWVSPKVYAILSRSEEGKDIIEKLPDMTDEEKDKAIDEFFGNSGKGSSFSADYKRAKEDDEREKDFDYDEDYERSYGPRWELDEDERQEAIDDIIETFDFSKKVNLNEIANYLEDKYDVSKEEAFMIINEQKKQRK